MPSFNLSDEPFLPSANSTKVKTHDIAKCNTPKKTVHSLADSGNLVYGWRADVAVELGDLSRAEHWTPADGRRAVADEVVHDWAGLAVRTVNDHSLS